MGLRLWLQGKGFWRRRPVTEGAVRPCRIVVLSVAIRQHPRLQHGVELLQVQELIPHLAVEGLPVSVLPRTARLDVERRAGPSDRRERFASRIALGSVTARAPKSETENMVV